MSKSTINNIENTLERHRVRLEASLEKLRKALVRWQTYSAEYEGLKEELLELPQDASKECMIKVGYNFGGTVIDSAGTTNMDHRWGTEALNLLGENAGFERNRDQVIQTINHRIVYVSDNINKVENQIEQGDEKLAGLLVMQSPDVLTEDGDPIIEIREDLDENGNIISSTTQPHGNGQVQRLNLDDLEQFQKYVEDAAGGANTSGLQSTIDQPTAAIVEGHEPNEIVESAYTEIDTATSVPVHEIRLDELPEEEPSRIGDATTQPTKPLTQPMAEGESHHRPTSGSVSNSSLREEDFVLSVDEPPDSADLRRQMIDYNLHDIGAVVAELELEEDDYDDVDEDEDEDEDGDEDEDEEEDRYGRTTSRIITADIEREMQALQARIRDRREKEEVQNRKPKTALELPNAAQVKIFPEEQEAPSPLPSKKKGVTFSEKLDIAVIPPEPKPVPQEYVLPPSPTLDSDDAIPFLVDLLAREQMKEDMENAGCGQSGATLQSNGWGTKIKHDTEAQEKKVSRFKASRIANTVKDLVPETTDRTPLTNRTPAVKLAIIERQTVSPPSPAPPQAIVHDKPEKGSLFKPSKIMNVEPPTVIFNDPSLGIHKSTVATTSQLEGAMGLDQDETSRPLLAPIIIEKPPTIPSSLGDIPLAPSELDHAIHKQEVAVEYFKTRNRMIQREGGFLPREEEEMFVPVDDGKKKVSRFKAARLGMGKVSPQ